MNWLDLIILVLMVIFGLKGILNGIIREVFGITGIIGGLYFAVRYKNDFGHWFSRNIYDLSSFSAIDGKGTEAIVGFLALLFFIWIISLIVGEILAKLVQLSGQSLLNRIGGFFFGCIKVFFIFSVFAILVKSSVFLNNQTKPFLENSFTFPYLIKFGKKIMKMDPVIAIKENMNIGDINVSGDINVQNNPNLGGSNGN